MLRLGGQRGGVRLVGIRFFLRRRMSLHTAGSAVVTDVVHRSVVHHDRLVVDIGHIGYADVSDTTVVVKPASAPFAPDKSHADVAKTVINASVEAHVRPPVAGMPRVESAAPSPIAGGPKHPDGRNDPRSGHPVVSAVIVPGPVAGCPEIARTWTNRLSVHRQRGGSNADRNPHGDLPKRRGRKRHDNHT